MFLENITGVKPVTLEYPQGNFVKNSHLNYYASAYLQYTLGTVPQLLHSYFHPHFHTYSITCSKELTTLSLSLPVATNYMDI